MNRAVDILPNPTQTCQALAVALIISVAPVVHHRTRSLDQTLPYIGELMKYGQITLGNVRPVGCVAVAHDGRQTVSMLLRREGETVTELLNRLDLAMAKALNEGIHTDEVNLSCGLKRTQGMCRFQGYIPQSRFNTFRDRTLASHCLSRHLGHLKLLFCGLQWQACILVEL